jgi:hypothetical protein
VTSLRTKPEKRNIIRSSRFTLTNDDRNGKIPYGAPIWTLNRAALRYLNWGDKEVPIYDPESEREGDDGDDNNEENNDNDAGTSRSSRKRKRKEKKFKKSKKRKNR